MWAVVSVSWEQADYYIRRFGDNKDELLQRLEKTANRLLALERTAVSGVPKAAEEAMENLKSYVVFRSLQEYH